MTYFKWTEDLAVGNTFIDNDHQKLIEMVNRLHTLMQEGKGKEVLGKVLTNLITYTKEHFRREEDLMRNIRYAGFAAHREEHEKLLKQVLELHEKFENGTATLSVQVLHMLKDWLLNHIGKSDQELANTTREIA